MGSESVEKVLAIYEDGRYVGAYREGVRLGLWREPRELDQMLLAGRVLRNVGGMRRARLLFFRAARRYRDSPEARFWWVQALRSPVDALLLMERLGDPRGVSDELLRNWHLLRAMNLAVVRDVRGAEIWWARAKEHGESPWLWCARSMLDEQTGALEAALEAAQHARALETWFTPAVHLEINLLRTTGKPDEALALSEAGCERLESYALSMGEHFMRAERGEFAAALRSLDQAVARCPLMERELHDGLLARILDTAYSSGDLERVARLAAATGDERMQELASRGPASEADRCILPVPLVPQRHDTCAPASMASVGKYWQVPTDHEEIVETICRDGTSAYSERKWAVDEGWVARELTMTWDSTRALIDAGFPFTFVTTFETSAHLQVAMGYDARLETVIIRDPSSMSMVEMPWREIERDNRAFGPRAMVMVPAAKAAELAALDLPDAALFDLLFELEGALDRHDRPAAEAARRRLARFPKHVVTLRAAASLAHYDDDRRAQLDWARAMLEQHPDEPRLRLLELRFMAGIDTFGARLERALALAASRRSPAVLAELAELLRGTPSGTARAGVLFRHALTLSPTDPSHHRALADHLWAGGERTTSLLLYRFSSCLAPANEAAAWAYFIAARLAGKADEGMAHLRARADALGAVDPKPIITLADAYWLENRRGEALELLAASEDVDDLDGGFLLALAQHHLSSGDLTASKRLLERASGKVRRADWLRVAARVATFEGDRKSTADCFREIIERTPLAMDAQRALVELLRAEAGQEKAIEHLRRLAEQFPHHMDIGTMLYEALQSLDESAAIAHLHEYATRHEDDCWAQREIAGALARAGDVDGARSRVEAAKSFGDDSPALHMTRAIVDLAAGDSQSAILALEAAIERSVDSTFAMAKLLGLASDADTARRHLDRIFAELVRQHSSGEGLSAYVELAGDWLGSDEIDAKLDELVRRRPQFFAAHEQRIVHLATHSAFDRARALAEELVATFSLVPEAWHVLAEIHGRRGELDAQIGALEQALAINPRWDVAIRSLAQAHAMRGDRAEARRLIEQAIAHHPFEATNHGCLAELHWFDGERDAALHELETALTLEPSYSWAWDRLASWTEDPNDAIDFARKLSQTRGAASTVWMALAELMPHAPLSARLECVDEAIRRAPSNALAYDMKAMLLAGAGSFDEALEVCRPEIWADKPPISLRGRRAWILAARGEPDSARKELLAVVAEVPTYDWGIETLLGWAYDEGEAEYLDTARKLAELAPESATVQGHLGEARRLNGHYEKAEAAYSRALELRSGDRFARLGLVDLYLGQRRLDQARAVLDLFEPHDVDAIVRRGQLALHDDDQSASRASLERLLELPEIEPAAFDMMLEPLGKAPLPAHLRALLDAWMRREDAGDHVGYAWLRFVGGGLFALSLWRHFARRHAPSKARSYALSLYLEGLADRGREFTFRWFLRLHSRLLRSDTRTWGMVSYALLAFGRFRKTIRWLKDYRRRDDVEAWMLWNLALAARLRKRIKLAMEVHRYALLLPDQSFFHNHRLGAALAEVVDGNVSAAENHLEDAVGPRWTETDTFVAALTRALIDWRQSQEPAKQRHRKLSDALSYAKARLGGLSQHPECEALFNWVVARIAWRHMGLGGVGWYLRTHSRMI